VIGNFSYDASHIQLKTGFHSLVIYEYIMQPIEYRLSAIGDFLVYYAAN